MSRSTGSSFPPSPACVVAVGGLDPGGGAGLVRDFATAEARQARAILVGTAWTDQSPRGVAGFEPRAVEQFRDAFRRALAEAPRGRTAVKVGMVATPALADAIGEALDAAPFPLVLDPVLGASAGGALFAGEASALLPLARRAALVTPNLAEAAALTGRPIAATVEEAREAARALRALGVAAVLVKGGHLAGDAADVLVTGAGEQVLSAPRLPGASPRGTGCALATAIAAALAGGAPLEAAVAEAKAWLHERIRAARPVGDERFL